MRAAVILAGVALGLGGFLAAVIYSIIIGSGCNGTDAGEPPSPDSRAPRCATRRLSRGLCSRWGSRP
jgi:hypothetical protein